ncbi:PaaI family thioesterase [Alkalicoccus daliensis]|uniref:Uncharacterized domain 1-containing protein n=1 Tax=Alkalicoccus daliensis TaxID=745820 RepID=A0A1H0IEL1_9BACI|nr:PaaI family thioesterase [Alkalicoccus daliensis]SDO29838.1 uncharacterized domain 1-containing protein [Alkalicoccus daliensis]
MNSEELVKKAERAAEVHNDGSPNVFLYSLFDFSFDYLEETEEVILKVPVSDLMYNPVGFIHGGVVGYIADTAMGHLCAAFNERPSVSLELKTQFLNTAKSGTLEAKAYFLKKGKNVQYVECTIHSEDKKLLSKISGTFYTLPDES